VTIRYRLLIADKNPRIRDFLKREFTTVGYTVRLAETGEQLLKILSARVPVDLLIIDPDFPDTDYSVLTKTLQEHIPPLQVVLHTLDADMNTPGLHPKPTQWVEKNGCSVENLKKTVAGMLAIHQQASHRAGVEHGRPPISGS
jgi:DNA-binding NtrC family response regulator